MKSMNHRLPSARNADVHDAYQQYKQRLGDRCAFCSPEDQLIKAYSTQLIIQNIFPYARWDYADVADHIMLIPKRHLLSLTEQTNEEKIEYVNILADYESRGYSAYTRAPVNNARSVAHIHTHLLLLK